MRFYAGATALLAAAVVRAEDAASAAVESDATSTSIVKPTFTVRH